MIIITQVISSENYLLYKWPKFTFQISLISLKSNLTNLSMTLPCTEGLHGAPVHPVPHAIYPHNLFKSALIILKNFGKYGMDEIGWVTQPLSTDSCPLLPEGESPSGWVPVMVARGAYSWHLHPSHTAIMYTTCTRRVSCFPDKPTLFKTTRSSCTRIRQGQEKILALAVHVVSLAVGLNKLVLRQSKVS